MLLIATDEAGYGPKLGPLVIVSTAWHLPDSITTSPSQPSLDPLFECVREPHEIDGVKIAVDDSKAVYQSKGKVGLDSLHAVVSAATNWVPIDSTSLREWISAVAAQDGESLAAAPWLNRLTDQSFLSHSATESTIANWSKTGLQLARIHARIITARAFNHACASGMNKADLLSESTLALVRRSMESFDDIQGTAEIFCDRHGGRRFYGGVLQHTFDESPVEMISESKRQSVYRIRHATTNAVIRFTVKGDSFTPVAMSSIIAKYLRERLMQSFNAYFGEQHQGDAALKPTAGYPVDADRYLDEIAPIVKRLRIQESDLVRQR